MLSNPCYDAIKSKIALLEYLPGRRFSETELANEFCIPRTKIREAFKLLAQDKLVRIIPQKITTISKLNLSNTIDSIFIIQSLLVAIIKEPAPTSIKLKLAISKLEQEISHLEQEDIIKDDDFFTIDHQFYLLLCQLKHFQRLTNLLLKEKVHIDRMMRFALKQEGSRPIITFYRQILIGIRSENKEFTLSNLLELSKILEAYSFKAEQHYPEYFQ